MPIRAELLPGEPILIVMYLGDFTPNLVEEVLQQTQAKVVENGGPVYCIADVRAVTTEFEHILLAQKRQLNTMVNSDLYVIPPVFVGTEELVNWYSNNPQVYKAGTVIFSQIGDAVEYIRGCMDEAASAG